MCCFTAVVAYYVAVLLLCCCCCGLQWCCRTVAVVACCAVPANNKALIRCINYPLAPASQHPVAAQLCSLILVLHSLSMLTDSLSHQCPYHSILSGCGALSPEGSRLAQTKQERATREYVHMRQCFYALDSLCASALYQQPFRLHMQYLRGQ